MIIQDMRAYRTGIISKVSNFERISTIEADAEFDLVVVFDPCDRTFIHHDINGEETVIDDLFYMNVETGLKSLTVVMDHSLTAIKKYNSFYYPPSVPFEFVPVTDKMGLFNFTKPGWIEGGEGKLVPDSRSYSESIKLIDSEERIVDFTFTKMIILDGTDNNNNNNNNKFKVHLILVPLVK